MQKIIAIKHTLRHVYKHDVDLYLECIGLMTLIYSHVESYKFYEHRGDEENMKLYLSCIKHIMGLFIHTVQEELTKEEALVLYGRARQECRKIIAENFKQHSTAVHFIIREWENELGVLLKEKK